MRQQRYYRNNGYTSNYGYGSPNRHPRNNANYYNYVPRDHHHWLIVILVVILCIAGIWFAFDHYLDSSDSAPQTTTVNRTVVNKNAPNRAAPVQRPNKVRPVQQPNVGKLEKEMNRLNVSSKDQATAINFYEKQSVKNQMKMNKMISLVNKVIPSDALKRKTLRWILS